MRRKTKGLIALAASALLCLSMGATVLADGSSTDKDIPMSDWGMGTDKDGKRVTVKSEKVSADVEKVLKDENAVKDILKDAGFDVKDDNQVVVLGAAEYKGEIPEGGADLTFFLGYNTEKKLDGLKAGDTIYVLHQKADGSWEVINGEVVVGEYGQISVKAHLDSLSPIAFVKVMSNGKVVVLDKVTGKPVGELSGDKVTPVTVKTSPKTGE